MAKTTISIAMLMSLMLVALPAAADHGKRGKRDQRETKIEKVAHKLARATHELHADAHYDGRRNRAYRRAVASLHDLDRSAARFHARVERAGIHSTGTQRALYRLHRDYDNAVYRVDRLRHRNHLRRDVARVGKLMHKLDREIAKFERRRDRYRGYADHDSRHDRWQVSFAWNF